MILASVEKNRFLQGVEMDIIYTHTDRHTNGQKDKE